ncbi:MAG TPA: N-acetylneuraminate synthase family protein [Vicinamibacterales bacterium]|jgi:sialic acid synthase SpsE
MCIEIGARHVGPAEPLFVIAELGINHRGSLQTALDLLDAAADAGASAVKLQTIEADRLVAESCPAPAHVAARSLREFFRQFELDEAAHRAIAERARVRGVAMMSTPFSEEAVDLLDRIGCDALKIASGDLTHTRLIERAARTGRPLILSTGMSDLHDVAAAVGCARSAGARQIGLLHCVSAYPVPAGSENLRAIAELARVFAVPVGLSDHTTEPLAAALAVALGASIYERHFVLDEANCGADAAVSSTPTELCRIIVEAERARRALGHGRKICLPAEAVNVEASRRSLYALRDLEVGDVVGPEDFTALRPASGLAADRWRELVGVRLVRRVGSGGPFLDTDIEAQREKGHVVHVA